MVEQEFQLISFLIEAARQKLLVSGHLSQQFYELKSYCGSDF